MINMQIPLHETRLKELIKEAFIEVLEERRDIFREAMKEVLEGISLSRAIQEAKEPGLHDEDEGMVVA